MFEDKGHSGHSGPTAGSTGSAYNEQPFGTPTMTYSMQPSTQTSMQPSTFSYTQPSTQTSMQPSTFSYTQPMPSRPNGYTIVNSHTKRSLSNSCSGTRHPTCLSNTMIDSMNYSRTKPDPIHIIKILSDEGKHYLFNIYYTSLPDYALLTIYNKSNYSNSKYWNSSYSDSVAYILELNGSQHINYYHNSINESQLTLGFSVTDGTVVNPNIFEFPPNNNTNMVFKPGSNYSFSIISLNKQQIATTFANIAIGNPYCCAIGRWGFTGVTGVTGPLGVIEEPQNIIRHRCDNDDA